MYNKISKLITALLIIGTIVFCFIYFPPLFKESKAYINSNRMLIDTTIVLPSDTIKILSYNPTENLFTLDNGLIVDVRSLLTLIN